MTSNSGAELTFYMDFSLLKLSRSLGFPYLLDSPLEALCGNDKKMAFTLLEVHVILCVKKLIDSNQDLLILGMIRLGKKSGKLSSLTK